MTDFYIPERFDAAKAEEGVELNIRNEAGHSYGTFKTILFDKHSKFLQVQIERFKRQNSKDAAANGDHANIYAFVQICLKGWSGVKDKNGKEVPFSTDAAFKYLSHPKMKWPAEALLEEASNVLHFQADPVAEQEQVLGNSEPSSIG